MITHPHRRAVVAAAERYADGEAAAEELSQAADAAAETLSPAEVTIEFLLEDALGCLAADEVTDVAGLATQFRNDSSVRPEHQHLQSLPDDERRRRWQEVAAPEARQQAAILRDIAGNPFHYDPMPLDRELLLDSAVMAWEGGRLERVAGEVYRSGEFARFPELADLLEAAGWGDAFLVRHLREPGPPVRGCWALDLLRGRR